MATTRIRKTVPVQQLVMAQPHRANPANPATANCAMWLSPEQVEQAKAQRLAQGRTLMGTTPCVCGNHDRMMWQ